MGIIKDWNEDTEGYCFKYKVINLLSPIVWLRLHKYRKQRADRGWSDRDTWGAGDHIAKMTAEMLQHLNDESYTDWPEWFKFNVQEPKSDYKNIQSIIDDIDNYLKFTNTSWSDNLTDAGIDYDGNNGEETCISCKWLDESGKKLTDTQITTLIKKHCNQQNKLYKKASKAMQFFGRHFSSFWD